MMERVDGVYEYTIGTADANQRHVNELARDELGTFLAPISI